jgi:hypothetical protein
LLSLPRGSDVRVARENPIYWQGKSDEQRWFHSVDELTKSIHFGDFGKMLIVETPLQKIDFPKGCAQAILDDPKRKLSGGKDAFTHAETRLRAAARNGKINLKMERRGCSADCSCVEKYGSLRAEVFNSFFNYYRFRCF